MKTGILIFGIIISLQLVSCNVKKNIDLEIEKLLIEKIISTGNKVEIYSSNKVIILRTQYCQDSDCEEFFKGYKEQIQLFTREDVFMRGVTSYLEIIELDKEKKRVKLNRRHNKEIEIVEIKL